MTWLAALLGLALVVLGVKVVEEGRVTSHIAAGVIFAVAGMLFMLPTWLP